MPTRRGTGNEPDQTARFEAGEGNAWFRRNNAGQRPGAAFEIDVIEDVLGAFRGEIKAILEVGCSDGRKIERMTGFFGASGSGIDPSTEAVVAGRARLAAAKNASVALSAGTADALPFEAGAFDLVHLGFSLYVVARERIFASLAEADRVLRPGGFLTIFDFDPPTMHGRRYTHLPGVFSYKARYDEWLTGTGHYHLVAKRSFSHASSDFTRDANERVALTVLHKEPQPYPVRD